MSKRERRAKAEKMELPREAYAIVGVPDDPTTWQLPHHTRNNNVNWAVMDTCAAYLTLQGHNGKRVDADLEQIIGAARHLAAHYVAKGLPIPRGLTPML